VQSQFVQKSLFDDLVQDQKAIGIDASLVMVKRFRHVPVDVNLLPVLAVPGYIGDIVVAIELLDARVDGLEDIQHDVITDIITFGPYLLVRIF
jgi:hypothetical protein